MTDFILDEVLSKHTTQNCLYRQQALNYLRENGLPTRKDESWKYFDIGKAHLAQKFAPTESLNEKKLKPRLPIDETPFHIQNGHFVGGQHVYIASINQHYDKELWNKLCAQFELNSFHYLNTLLFSDGAHVHIKADQQVDQALYIPHISSQTGQHQIRHHIHLEKGASATVIEFYDGEGVSHCGAETLSVLEEGATLNHIKIVDARDSSHISHHYSHIGQDAKIRSYLYTISGAAVRADTSIQLNARGAEAHLYGLYQARKKEVIEHHTFVNHKVPETSCHETYYGLAEDESQATFNGCIYVSAGANKTKAELLNKNLLLSNQATINTKPELQIFADDVKCAHGATVGQLNPDLLYYLQSRGFSLDNAEKMLRQGFTQNIIQALPGHDALKDHLSCQFI